MATAGAWAQDDDQRITVRPYGGRTLVIRAPHQDPESGEIQRRLRLKVTMEFNDASVEEVATFICKMTGINLVIDPALRAAALPGVTLSVQDMSARNALNWLVLQSGVHMSFVNEAIYLSLTRPRLPMAVRLVDVSDMIQPPRSFPGPRLGLGPEGATILFPGPEEEPAAPERGIEELAQLLEDQLNQGR